MEESVRKQYTLYCKILATGRPELIRFCITGIYFGYPPCCIADFIYRFDTGWSMSSNQQIVHKNLGFIPCPTCSERLVATGLPVESLIENRICNTPFTTDLAASLVLANNSPTGGKINEYVDEFFKRK